MAMALLFDNCWLTLVAFCLTPSFVGTVDSSGSEAGSPTISTPDSKRDLERTDIIVRFKHAVDRLSLKKPTIPQNKFNVTKRVEFGKRWGVVDGSKMLSR